MLMVEGKACLRSPRLEFLQLRDCREGSSYYRHNFSTWHIHAHQFRFLPGGLFTTTRTIPSTTLAVAETARSGTSLSSPSRPKSTWQFLTGSTSPNSRARTEYSCRRADKGTGFVLQHVAAFPWARDHNEVVIWLIS